MSKYIDVDVFIKSFRKAFPRLKAQVDPDLMPKAYAYLRGGEAIIEDLIKFPAADVVEVLHGRWIRKEDDSCYWYECSECGEKLAKTQWGNDYFSAYCPNCGTLMDK